MDMRGGRARDQLYFESFDQISVKPQRHLFLDQAVEIAVWLIRTDRTVQQLAASERKAGFDGSIRGPNGKKVNDCGQNEWRLRSSGSAIANVAKGPIGDIVPAAAAVAAQPNYGVLLIDRLLNVEQCKRGK
jgi:hypothetical protein